MGKYSLWCGEKIEKDQLLSISYNKINRF